MRARVACSVLLIRIVPDDALERLLRLAITELLIRLTESQEGLRRKRAVGGKLPGDPLINDDGLGDFSLGLFLRERLLQQLVAALGRWAGADEHNEDEDEE